jgi:hypothetical protein
MFVLRMWRWIFFMLRVQSLPGGMKSQTASGVRLPCEKQDMLKQPKMFLNGWLTCAFN